VRCKKIFLDEKGFVENGLFKIQIDLDKNLWTDMEVVK